MEKWLAIGIIVLNALVTAIALLLFKFGADKHGDKSFIQSVVNPYIIGGFVLYALASFVFIWLLRSNDLSFLYPLTSVVYIFVILSSFIFLKEAITINKGIGVFLIIMGVLFIAR